MGDEPIRNPRSSPASNQFRSLWRSPMKIATSLLCATILLCASMPATYGQEEKPRLPTLKPFTTVIPPRNVSPDDVAAAAALAGLPVWSTTLSATKDGASYTVSMVGKDPSSTV